MKCIQKVGKSLLEHLPHETNEFLMSLIDIKSHKKDGKDIPVVPLQFLPHNHDTSLLCVTIFSLLFSFTYFVLRYIVISLCLSYPASISFSCTPLVQFTSHSIINLLTLASLQNIKPDELISVYVTNPRLLMQFLEFAVSINPKNTSEKVYNTLLELYLRDYAGETPENRSARLFKAKQLLSAQEVLTSASFPPISCSPLALSKINFYHSL